MILSTTIPLSSNVTGGGTEPRHSVPIPSVSCVHREGPILEITPLTYQRRPRQDHDYCIQAFGSIHHDNSFPDESYDFPLSDYSTTAPSIAWGYQPTRVTGYQLQPVRDYSASSLDPTAWDTSSCWYLKLDSKEDLVALRNIGLTKINLERLAETGSVSESLFPSEKSRADKRNDRVKKRRETFVSVMAGNSKRQIQCHQPAYYDFRNNPLLEKWLKLDQLEVDVISRLLDDITDVLYKRKEKERRKADCASIGRELLHRGTSIARRQLMFGHNSSSQRQPPNLDRGVILSPQKRTRARVISSARRQLCYEGKRVLEFSAHMKCRRGVPERVQSPQDNTIHRKIRALFAKSLASTTSTSKERFCVKRHSVDPDAHTNPPIWERSRSICSRGNSANSHINELEEDNTYSRQETKKQDSGRAETAIRGTSHRSLRSRTINISTKIKKPSKTIRENAHKMEQGRKGSKAMVCNQGEEDNSNTGMDWITLSEKWIKEPLNSATILALL